MSGAQSIGHTLDGLAAAARWVAWQTELRDERDSKPTKVPYNPGTGRKARSDDPGTWGTRAAAEARAPRLPRPFGSGGVGFELGEHAGVASGGVDCDTCRDPVTGALAPWALEVLRRFDTYAEVSPSGQGVKLFFIYDPADASAIREAMGTPTGRKWTAAAGEHPPGVEFYITGRFFAVTDQRVPEAPAELRKVPLPDLLWLVREAGPQVAKSANGAASGKAGRNGADKSRSAKAFKVAVETRRAGHDFAAFLRALDADPETAAWKAEKGVPNGGRELRRTWDHAGGAVERDGRPEIIIKGGEIAREVDAAEAAMIAGNSGIYQRGRMLVQTGMVSVEISNDRKARGMHILPLEEHALLEAMTRTARWTKMDGRTGELREVNAPPLAVKVYMARAGKWNLPVLTGIVSAPTLRPDGSVLSRPGYDAATGLIFDPCGQAFPAIRDQPTKEHARAALEALKQPIRDFPFVKGADKSVALSAFLTAAIRRSLRTAPLHGFTAPAAGTGKSKLADMASVLATGREAGTIAQGAKPEEFEKRLGAMLLAAENVIAIDNCEHTLGGEFLCQVMTQPIVRVRILGESKMPEVLANSLITATGNNLALSGDMNRRAILCSLDAEIERPETRVFEYDPVEVAKADRPRLIAGALTVLRAYHVAGRPKRSEPLGSFTEWSLWVRDALLWLGEADPVSTMDETRKMDPVLEALCDVMENWRQAFGTERVTVKEAIARAEQVRTGERFGKPEFVNTALRDTLLGVAGKGGSINPRALGRWLGKHRGRVVGGFRFKDDGVLSGNLTWLLEAVASRPAAAAAE